MALARAARARRTRGAPVGGRRRARPAGLGDRRDPRLFEEWGEIDRSHRRLAHRGSYTGRVWVSPATVFRVLAANGVVLEAPPRAGRPERAPFPQWATYTKNTIWIYDTTRFRRCRDVGALAVMDLVTRTWITEIVSAEETSTQVQVAFTDALELEGPMGLVEARLDETVDPRVEQPQPPMLLAVSDNGPQMTSGSTREFMALCAMPSTSGAPALRPTRPGSRASSATSRPNGRTSTTSATPRPSGSSRPASATSTTPSGCTPASATSPRPTSTKAAATGSAQLADAACGWPARGASNTIEHTEFNANHPGLDDAD